MLYFPIPIPYSNYMLGGTGPQKPGAAAPQVFTKVDLLPITNDSDKKKQ